MTSQYVLTYNFSLAQHKREQPDTPAGEPHPPVSGRLPASARREQLIEVASDLFSRNGFNGTTTREIAVAAGVTEAIIFRHFETKEQLYKAIIDRSMSSSDTAEWAAKLRAAMERNEDETVVRHLITAIISMHKNDPKFERLMLYAALEGNQVALLHVRQITAEIVDAFMSYFRRRQKQGALRANGPEIGLMAIVGMAKHYAHCRYVHGLGDNTISDEQAIEHFTAVALHGLASSPTEENGTSTARKR